MKRIFIKFKIDLKIIFLFFLFDGIISFHLTAQDDRLSSVVFPSPNISSLNKYIDVPINTYTGSADVSIPIFSSKIGNKVSFDVSLSYHSSGIKVSEISSNVGLGWSLNAGGCISRNIVGLADDKSNVGYFENDYDLSYFENLSPEELEEFWYYNLSEQINVDLEPDHYYFNFCGKSGKLIIDKNLNIKTIPFYNWKIELYDFIGENNVTQWIITTEDGVKYFFGKSFDENRICIENCYSITTGGLHQTQQIITGETGWHLMDVRLPNNSDFLKLSYNPYQISHCISNSESVSRYDWCPVNYCDDPVGDSFSWYYGKVERDCHRISKIESRQFSIDFIADFPRSDLVGDFAINEIKVYTNYNIYKDYNLYYSHFYYPGSLNGCVCPGQNTEASRRYRLKLDSLGISNQSTEMNLHKFTYNSINLPERLSFAIDHWGYYNGQNGNISPIPTIYYPTWWGTHATHEGSNKQPNGNSKACSLIRIDYPTGGYTTFEYENHEAYTEDFEFEQNYNSSWEQLACVNHTDLVAGIPGFKHEGSEVKVHLFPLEQPCSFDVFCDDGSAGDCGFWIKIVDGDGEVAWQSFGQVNENQDKYWYFYLPKANDKDGYDLVLQPCSPNSNIEDVYCCISKLSENFYYPHNKVIGGIRIKKIKHVSEDDISIIKSYDYRDSDDHSTGTLGVKPIYFYSRQFYQHQGTLMTLCASGVVNVFLTTPAIDLSMAYGSSVEYSKVTVTEENPSGLKNGKEIKQHFSWADFPDYYIAQYPFVPKMDYSWGRGMLKKIEYHKKDENNDEIIQEHRKSYDYDLGSYITGVILSTSVFRSPRFLSALYPNPILINPYDLFTGNQYLISDSIINYSEQNILEFVKNYYYENAEFKFVTRETQENSNGNIITTEYKYPFDFDGISILDEMVSRNDINNIVSKSTYNNGVLIDGKLTAFQIWDNYHILPREFKTMVNQEYKTDLYIDDYDAQGNIIEYHIHDNITNSLIWSYDNNYPVIKAENIIYDDLNSTVNSITGNLTSLINQVGDMTNLQQKILWEDFNIALRNHPTLQNCKITTYTYKPLVGITSETDPAGRTTYYEYDEFNRLETIRDQTGNVIKHVDYHYVEIDNE